MSALIRRFAPASAAYILPSAITTQVLISSAFLNQTAPPPADVKRREMSDHAPPPNGHHNGQHEPPPLRASNSDTCQVTTSRCIDVVPSTVR